MQTAEAISHERLIETMRRTFGDEFNALFDDEKVVEIMLNPDCQILVEKHGAGITRFGNLAPSDSRNIMNLVASWLGVITDADNPVVEGALPLEFGRARFEGLLPPLVDNPSFAIRLRARSVFTLDDYVSKNIMSQNQANTIKNSVKNRKNILVSGGTGSGKTTLLNAVLHEISEQSSLDSRVIIIEDTNELQCKAENSVQMLTSKNVNMTLLLKATMRLRPDRIVVGEVRDGAALALLKAWNTGHPGGCATVHANNPQAALVRLDNLCQEAGVPSQKILIDEAVDLVLQIERAPETAAGRRISEIFDVKNQIRVE